MTILIDHDYYYDVRLLIYCVSLRSAMSRPFH